MSLRAEGSWEDELERLPFLPVSERWAHRIKS